MPRLRFAILGFGLHAQKRLAPAFARAAEAELVGLWRRNVPQGQSDASSLGVLAFPSAEALCSAPEVDAVLIASPDALHLEHARLALAAGKAVLCEKPLAMNTGEATEMQALASAAGVLLGVAQNFRFNRSVERLREQLASGAIGTPQFARAVFSYFANRSARKWIADPALATGGPIADVGVHCVDALRYILGEEVRTLSTIGTSDALSGELEAIAVLQLGMSGGTFATVETSARAPYRTLLEISGTDGVLTAENGFAMDRPVEIVQRRAGDVIATETVTNADGYTRMLDAFARAVRAGEPFTPDAADGIRNQRVLDAAARTLHTGTRETL